MREKLIALFLLLTVLVFAGTAPAATSLWKGGTGDWGVASNWYGTPSPTGTTYAYRTDGGVSVINVTSSATNLVLVTGYGYNTVLPPTGPTDTTILINSGVTLATTKATQMWSSIVGAKTTLVIYGTYTGETSSSGLDFNLSTGTWAQSTDTIKVYGTINVGLTAPSGRLNISSDGLGIGTVYIYNGGTANVRGYLMRGSGSTSNLYIEQGGVMYINGNVTSQVAGDITAHRMHVGTFDTNGNLLSSRDPTTYEYCYDSVANKTWIIPGTQPPPPPLVAVSILADTSAGWDFNDIATNIAGGNSIDLDDLSVMATHWLNASCSDANYWCARADLDKSASVDFLDYALLASDWSQTVADKTLLQTIYGTNQNSAGNITANNFYALNQNQGIAMAFNVLQNCSIAKATFKCFGINASNNLRIRLYDVNGLGCLNYGHIITRAAPGGTGKTLIDYSATMPASIPSHSELGDGRAYSDLVLTFNPQDVNAGDYLLVLDAAGPANNWGNLVTGSGADASAMAQYPDGVPLPKRATVTTSASAGNTYYYQLTSSSDPNYTPLSNLPAFQIKLN